MSSDDLGKLVAELNSKHGAEAVQRFGSKAPTPIATTPSGSLALDIAMGCGGWPKGRIAEVFGPESSGKTTIALHALAQVQKAGGVAGFIDAEHAIDMNYAQTLGVKTSDLLLCQPDSGEQALDIAESMVNSGKVGMIVIDSVAALTPQAEIDGAMGDQSIGLQARLMSRALRKLASICNSKETTIVFINQIRHKIGVMYGSPETTPGGNALKFYASIRLDVRRREQVKEGDDPVGSHTVVKVVKNKLAPPFEVAEMDIIWGRGIDKHLDLLNAAVHLGIVDKAGNWYKFGEQNLAMGLNKASMALASNVELARAVYQACRAKMAEK